MQTFILNVFNNSEHLLPKHLHFYICAVHPHSEIAKLYSCSFFYYRQLDSTLISMCQCLSVIFSVSIYLFWRQLLIFLYKGGHFNFLFTTPLYLFLKHCKSCPRVLQTCSSLLLSCTWLLYCAIMTNRWNTPTGLQLRADAGWPLFSHHVSQVLPGTELLTDGVLQCWPLHHIPKCHHGKLIKIDYVSEKWCNALEKRNPSLIS